MALSDDADFFHRYQPFADQVVQRREKILVFFWDETVRQPAQVWQGDEGLDLT